MATCPYCRGTGGTTQPCDACGGSGRGDGPEGAPSPFRGGLRRRRRGAMPPLTGLFTVLNLLGGIGGVGVALVLAAFSVSFENAPHLVFSLGLAVACGLHGVTGFLLMRRNLGAATGAAAATAAVSVMLSLLAFGVGKLPLLVSIPVALVAMAEAAYLGFGGRSRR
jgi:hypothetical protein